METVLAPRIDTPPSLVYVMTPHSRRGGTRAVDDSLSDKRKSCPCRYSCCPRGAVTTLLQPASPAARNALHARRGTAAEMQTVQSSSHSGPASAKREERRPLFVLGTSHSAMTTDEAALLVRESQSPDLCPIEGSEHVTCKFI